MAHCLELCQLASVAVQDMTASIYKGCVSPYHPEPLSKPRDGLVACTSIQPGALKQLLQRHPVLRANPDKAFDNVLSSLGGVCPVAVGHVQVATLNILCTIQHQCLCLVAS